MGLHNRRSIDAIVERSSPDLSDRWNRISRLDKNHEDIFLPLWLLLRRDDDTPWYMYDANRIPHRGGIVVINGPCAESAFVSLALMCEPTRLHSLKELKIDKVKYILCTMMS